MEQRHLQHLFWRAGFGATPQQLIELADKSREEVVNDLIYQSRRSEALEIDHSDYEDIDPMALMGDKAALKKAIQDSGKKLKQLNIAWINRLLKPKGLLREKMTLFWANHFVCRDNNSYLSQHYNNTLRTHALGSFRSLTKAVSKEASMIKYLNLKQNIRQHPNENFARELMELFTLGNHNYTEQDIKESARAFTGYGHSFKGEFHLKRRQHDYNNKTFFGRTGNYKGDDIIDIILVEKQCARFVSEKIYKYFVNDQINPDHVEEMANQFYPNYDIEELMRFVFTSNWFYDDINIGTKIKSPIEFLIGLNTIVPLRFEKEQQILALQKVLGQMLLFPPNVAGWEGGKQWIDSNTIFMRLRLPSVLLNGGEITFNEAGGFNDRYRKWARRKGVSNPFEVSSNWDAFEDHFSAIQIDELKSYIIQSPITQGTSSFIKKLDRNSKRDYCIQLMSLPEYQLC